ncbi:NAD-dependent epimerase/dehydratase family protein [Exiguobacterium alkaliphilum]|uniref:NAD-dependent epimerase/dehydratase family protein n=1 Tax=Exiguobacterium alkaliphilum TaxID=1428684 RepID=UPI001BA79146|nr:NAD-dependent epimerase/dehydratase family protein [Exiguobacterium alkaliphilum]QUE87492.1 NAD(P)H-binding protein [Exiguobacterium alkaliphilum]
MRKTIVIAGASGYIGSNVMDHLKEEYDIIALSRSTKNKEDEDHITWRSCDLFSYEQTREACEGADYAMFLVHSMIPDGGLTQATFEDMDALIADNFARATKANDIEQIVYLSGIIPKESKTLSRHLKSRLEVERILGGQGVPVTTIRAGLIIGPEGSSFPILAKLVKRLPVMILPNWTKTETHPIDLREAVQALISVVGAEALYDHHIDIGGPEVMTYRKMIEDTADVMGKRRVMIDFPFPTIKLSRLWVMAVTGEPKDTVYPLVESMGHAMVAKDTTGVKQGEIPFKEAVEHALEEEEKQKSGGGKKKKAPQQYTVRSIQRFGLPENKSALWMADTYFEWLGRLAYPLIQTTKEDDDWEIALLRPSLVALHLSLEDEATDDMASFEIDGGLFTKLTEDDKTGRLEFRRLPESDEGLVAIHEFVPALPWWFYTKTQAKAHLVVMWLFGRHVRLLGEDADEGDQVVEAPTN